MEYNFWDIGIDVLYLRKNTKMIKEFKAFILRGNVLDLAVAVIMGSAFGAIVSSLVNDVIMPPIGLLLGGVDFSDLQIVLKEGQDGQGEVALRYGAFIQKVLDFLIIAGAVFAAVKAYSYSKKKEEAKPPAPKGPTELEVLQEIRDELRRVKGE
jgi:large conductance mechanosensitive channel